MNQWLPETTSDSETEQQSEMNTVLVFSVAEALYSIPLDEVETTLAPTGVVTSLLNNQDIEGFVVYLNRAIPLVQIDKILKTSSARSPVYGGRIVVMKAGYGFMVDDLKFVRSVNTKNLDQDLQNMTFLNTQDFYNPVSAPAGAFNESCFTFNAWHGRALAIRVRHLHNVRLARAEDLFFSKELGAWAHKELPYSPIYDEYASEPHRKPFITDYGHIAYIYLSDGSLFGLVLNSGQLDDPGLPIEAPVVELDESSSSVTAAGALALVNGSEPRIVIAPDDLYAAAATNTHEFNSNRYSDSPAMERRMPLFDGDEGATTGGRKLAS
jgi:chemotaxis signal transduction protein